MKTVSIHDIYFETESGDKIRTKVSFTNGFDAMQYVHDENAKDSTFGRYIVIPSTRVCYESYEEYLTETKTNSVELQK